MSNYVVDIISNNYNNKTKEYKNIDFLFEEYLKINKKNKINQIIICLFFLFILPVFAYSITFFVKKHNFFYFCFFVAYVILFCYVIWIFFKTNNEIKELKIKIYNFLKQEKFIIEYVKDKNLYTRDLLLEDARKNRNINFCEGFSKTQDFLLKHPSIQNVIERKITIEYLKLHNNYQNIINKICKEQPEKTIIYQY